MRGLATDRRGEPILNPSWLNYPKAKAPGWGINGPGVSAEWSQGGESEWNSAAASADETRAQIYQDFEVPRAGEYKVWVRYADWANKAENFRVSITQGEDVATGRRGDAETLGLGDAETRRHADRRISFSVSPRRVPESVPFAHEFGTKEIVDAHDEVSMYWGWAFAWDGAAAKLEKGPARISIEIEKATNAPRHVDAVLITNDLTYVPNGRRKPDFAGMRYLRQWATSRTTLTPLIGVPADTAIPAAWQRPQIAGRDFLMPWNIAKEFWPLLDRPTAERPLYPFHAEPIDQFIEKYKGSRDVPIFSSKLVVPVIYIPNLPEYLREGSPFLRYLRETKSPFAVLINYGAAQFPAGEGEAAWKLLNGELRDQFLGWVSGESVGYVWDSAATDLKTSPAMSRKELLEAYRVFYDNALNKKWSAMFQTSTGPMWDRLIPAQSTSSTSFAHALAAWGVRLLGMETAAVQPMFAMRIAFTRGAARQFGGAFLYYHAPNFGDTATTFTHQQNFAGPNNFYHSRYGATMGPSLSWYRKSYYLYYMAGASAIYLEQGFDQFFKPGPGEHPLQLNPLGRITDEFMRFAEKHPDRGTPYTPVAFLLDPAHGFEMTDYPHWPFGVSQISRSDRALRELFGVAYYPGLVVEGEPATADRQAFVNGVFGDIFDVIVASDVQSPTSNVQGPTSNVQRPLTGGTAGVSPAGRGSSPTVKEGSDAAQSATSSAQRQLVTVAAGVSPATARRSLDEGLIGHSPVRQSLTALEGGKAANASPRLRVPASPRLRITPSPHLPVSGSPHRRVPASPRLPIPASPLSPYRAVVVGGHIEWSSARVTKLTDYVRNGGTLVINSAQIKGIPEHLLGIRLTGTTSESDNSKCLRETDQNLSGQMFRYEKVELKGANTLIATPSGDPLVTVNRVGKGSVVFSALADLLGIDGRITPFAAHMLAHVFADATPVKVRGDVEYLINRTGTGWVVTLFNNKGIYKPQQGLAQVDRSASVTVSLSVLSQHIESARERISDKQLAVKTEKNAQGVELTIASGGVAIVELSSR